MIFQIKAIYLLLRVYMLFYIQKYILVTKETADYDIKRSSKMPC